jgi:hypothetical protein
MTLSSSVDSEPECIDITSGSWSVDFDSDPELCMDITSDSSSGDSDLEGRYVLSKSMIVGRLINLSSGTCQMQ